MKCSSGKRSYPDLVTAEEALIEAHTQFEYRNGNGPVAVYICDECGNYHFTSQGPINEKLKQYLADGKIRKQQQANRWAEKFKRK